MKTTILLTKRVASATILAILLSSLWTASWCIPAFTGVLVHSVQDKLPSQQALLQWAAVY